MTERVKILIVDDEPGVTRLVNRILTKHGYEVIEVNDPQKVEEYLLYTTLGLVITDYMMPGMDGLQILRLIKGSNPNLPVIFLTGHGTINTAVEATKSGAVVFLTKPFVSEDLVQAVKTHALVDAVLPDDIRQTIETAALTDDEHATAPDKIILKGEIVSTGTVPEGLVEIKLADIVPGQLFSFPIYLQIYNKNTKKHYLRKLMEANTVFTTGLKTLLSKRGLGAAFIKEQDYAAFLEYYNAIKASKRFQVEKVRDRKKLVLYGKAVEAVSEIVHDPAENKNIKRSVNLVDDMFKTIVNDPVTYQDMFKLFKQDTAIFNHLANVCLLAVSFAVYLGMEERHSKQLGLGALFHDIGMNRVDKRILEKDSSLTEAEWREVKNHPSWGAAVLKASNLIPLNSIRVVAEHHEEIDGTGYPRGLQGFKISKLAIICRIVDKFDTLTTQKPYRDAFTAPEALKRIYLQERDSSMQKVIKQFISFLGGK